MYVDVNQKQIQQWDLGGVATVNIYDTGYWY
jgi:hypothetical protein